VGVAVATLNVAPGVGFLVAVDVADLAVNNGVPGGAGELGDGGAGRVVGPIVPAPGVTGDGVIGFVEGEMLTAGWALGQGGEDLSPEVGGDGGEVDKGQVTPADFGEGVSVGEVPAAVLDGPVVSGPEGVPPEAACDEDRCKILNAGRSPSQRCPASRRSRRLWHPRPRADGDFDT
jgi:hypothetical protein